MSYNKCTRWRWQNEIETHLHEKDTGPILDKAPSSCVWHLKPKGQEGHYNPYYGQGMEQLRYAGIIQFVVHDLASVKLKLH